MRSNYSTKESILFKRISFLICSLIITCSTQLKEKEPYEIPKLGFSQMEKEVNFIVQDAEILPDPNDL